MTANALKVDCKSFNKKYFLTIDNLSEKILLD